MKKIVTKMNTRLEQFLAAENISQTQFADTLGVARAGISHILAGRNKPSFEFITNMMRCYPALNIEWLLLGKGKMYKGQSQEPQEGLSPAQESIPTLFDTSEDDIKPIDTQIVEPENNAIKTETETKTERKISRIIVFYDDGTFAELG
ncbi:MAG: helix-turn-helix transcriptional regulator [Bacteroidales bacterium]|nr:helix-turn-helix transcriptional regulator [Bacteroidales bacterium]